MPVNRQITVSGYQGGRFTAVNLPRSTLVNVTLCQSCNIIRLFFLHCKLML